MMRLLYNYKIELQVMKLKVQVLKHMLHNNTIDSLFIYIIVIYCYAKNHSIMTAETSLFSDIEIQ